MEELMIKKYRYILGIIGLSMFLTGCISDSAQEVNSNELINLREENNQLINKLNDMENKLNNLEKDNEITKLTLALEEAEEEKTKLNAELADIKEKYKELQDEKDSIQDLAVGQVTANLVSCKNSYMSIDGGSAYYEEDDYYLEYNGDVYFSRDFIKTYYGYKNYEYGNVIKGFPLLNFLIEADGRVYLEELVNAHKDESKDKMNYVVDDYDGLTLTFGEVGLVSCVITKPTYLTDRGITVGSTRSDVQRAYGRLGSDTEKTWTTFMNNAEFSEGSKTVFTFDTANRVREIYYGW